MTLVHLPDLQFHSQKIKILTTPIGLASYDTFLFIRSGKHLKNKRRFIVAQSPIRDSEIFYPRKFMTPKIKLAAKFLYRENFLTYGIIVDSLHMHGNAATVRLTYMLHS